MNGHPRALNYESALLEACLGDPRVVVLTAENRAAIRGLPDKLGPRFIDVGICEQTMIGMAAGLALRGRVPVVHALATFLTMRAFEFIRTDVGIGALPVKLIGGVPGLLSEANGPTHQALEDIAIMRGIPGMDVFCPADEEELGRALPAILASPRPCYVRYSPGPARVRHDPGAIWGRAETLRSGADVTLLTYGFLSANVCRAADLLADDGIAARVLHLPALVPLDESAILTAARETDLLVTVEDHFVSGGLYTMVAELFLRRRVMAPVVPIAFEGRWFHPALLADVVLNEGFSPAAIAGRVRTAMTELRGTPLAGPFLTAGARGGGHA